MNQSLKSGAKVIVLSLGLVFVSPVYAQLDTNPSEADSSQKNRVYGITDDGLKSSGITKEFKEVPSLYTIVSRIFVVLVIMGGLAFLFIHYVRKGKLNLKSFTPLGTENSLIISETRMLGNKQYLVVVEYNTQKVLLGVSPGKIEHLCFLDSVFEEEPQDPSMTEELQGI